MSVKNAASLKALLGIEDWTKVNDTLSFDNLYGGHGGHAAGLPAFTAVSPIQAFASLGRSFHPASNDTIDFSKAAFLNPQNPVGDAQKALADAFSSSTAQAPSIGNGFAHHHHHHHHHSGGSAASGQASDASHLDQSGASDAAFAHSPVQSPVDVAQGPGSTTGTGNVDLSGAVQSPVAPAPVAVVPTVPGGPVPVGMPVNPVSPTSGDASYATQVSGDQTASLSGSQASAGTVDGFVPDIASHSLVNGVAAAGYDSKANAAQWNIAKTFGSDAGNFMKQYNGKGVHIGLYDDGIDKTNKAVMTSYDASRELVINGVKADPSILGGSGQGIHGTATAGIIDADASKVAGGAVTGMATGAGLTSVNVFNGAASGSGMLNAIAQMKNFDVTSNSWGWTTKWADFADVSGSFGQQLIANLTSAATTGRGGLGTVIVKSVGNDWYTDHRDANTQEFNADRHVLGIGATGQNGDVAYYSQRGSSVLVSGWSNGGGAAISTTDKTGAAGYSSGDTTNTFGGTSAAAPQVAAVVADMMGANSGLGARDVQNILAMSAVDTHSTTAFSTAKTGYMEYNQTVSKTNTWNGGGYHFGNDSGFGTVDGHAAVREAEIYHYFGPAQTYSNEASLSATAAGKAVSATAGATFSFNVTGSLSLENVSLALNVTTKNLDNMKVVLTDPNGIKSTMLDTSTTLSGETGNSTTGHTWTLGSHAYMGEVPAGTWTATVTDSNAADGLTVNSAKLNLYGSSAVNPHVFHYTDEAAKMLASDASRLTIHDPGATGSWLDLAMTTGNTVINLATGSTSTMGGKNLVTIGTDTTVNKVTLGDGFAQVTGNNNGDTIVGGHGSHIMTGGTGNDVLVAGWAGGTMTGGAGADKFTFNHDGFGREAVTDFKQGTDLIDLRGMGESFAGLKIVESGSTTTITGFNNSADTIVLTNMQNQHLKAGDFLFA